MVLTSSTFTHGIENSNNLMMLIESSKFDMPRHDSCSILMIDECFAELEEISLSKGDDSYDTRYPVERILVELACMGTRSNLLHKRYRVRCPGRHFDVNALAHMGTRFF